jgi:hypothetical protein
MIIDINMHADVREWRDQWQSHLQRGHKGGLTLCADARTFLRIDVQLGEGGVHLHAASTRHGTRSNNGSRNAHTVLVTPQFSEHERNQKKCLWITIVGVNDNKVNNESPRVHQSVRPTINPRGERDGRADVRAMLLQMPLHPHHPHGCVEHSNYELPCNWRCQTDA